MNSVDPHNELDLLAHMIAELARSGWVYRGMNDDLLLFKHPDEPTYTVGINILKHKPKEPLNESLN